MRIRDAMSTIMSGYRLVVNTHNGPAWVDYVEVRASKLYVGKPTIDAPGEAVEETSLPESYKVPYLR